MGKGGGGGAPPPQNQTVTQTNLPEYARPYFENLLQRGQAESYRDYTPYEGQRIQGFDPMQVQAQQETAAMQTPGQFGTATGFGTAAGLQALSAGQYAPTNVSMLTAQAPQLNQYQMGPAQGVQGAQVRTGSFTAPGAAQQFMSPYMQNVVDIQKQEALRDAQKTQLGANLAAARQGTYGGARQTLAMTERERNLADQMSKIQATGSQAAYQAAQQGFEQEQARRLQAQQASGQFGMQAQLANQQAGLTTAQQNLQALLGTQQLGAQQGMQAQLANQQALLEAQRLGEQSRQFGAGLGLQGAQAATQAAQTLGQLGQSQQATDLQRIQAQAAGGAEQRALEQQRLDMQYADFLRQRDYPMEQLSYYSSLLRGIPVQLGSTQTTYAQPPSIASQVSGLGLAGLGLYNLAK
jgi:hypothetical protein